MDSKTRAKLRSIAQGVSPSVAIGKTGLTDGVIDQIRMNLSAHELVKIDVLETADVDKKELMNEICDMLGIKNTVVHPGFAKGISKEEVIEVTEQNAKALYRI